MTATHDWSNYFVCNDIQHLYNMFIDDVHALISDCIPVKHVTVSPRDSPYVTPLVKSVLRKCYKLRRSGRTAFTEQLAIKINLVIQDTRSTQYHKLAEASPKELWAAVKATSGEN